MYPSHFIPVESKYRDEIIENVQNFVTFSEEIMFATSLANLIYRGL
jgi:hypothetical protein